MSYRAGSFCALRLINYQEVLSVPVNYFHSQSLRILFAISIES